MPILCLVQGEWSRDLVAGWHVIGEAIKSGGTISFFVPSLFFAGSNRWTA
ncbi:hypothetical protein DAI22_05g174900 [Oryza sativa Japonica Group]|nr:hypothetical protein DAI22_05g174900 [Oryza sativa Japonica Group]